MNHEITMKGSMTGFHQEYSTAFLNVSLYTPFLQSFNLWFRLRTFAGGHDARWGGRLLSTWISWGNLGALLTHSVTAWLGAGLAVAWAPAAVFCHDHVLKGFI